MRVSLVNIHTDRDAVAVASLRPALNEAIADEYKARAVYRLTLDTFGEIQPFANILQAEERHIQALMSLFSKYGMTIPPDDSTLPLQAPDTVKAACEAGVQAEIDNAAMYDRLLVATRDYPDVQRVFANLQQASQMNHLPAFQRCASDVATVSSVNRSLGNECLQQATRPQPRRASALHSRLPTRRLPPSSRSTLWLISLGLVTVGVLIGWRYINHKRRLQSQTAIGLRTWVQQLSQI